MGYSLGVDLGTTFVKAAIASATKIQMFTLGDRSMEIPAVVYLREDGTLLTGEAADLRAVNNPDRASREFKRRLGNPTPAVLGGQPRFVNALLAALLHDVVQKVTETEGEPPNKVVLTYRGNWGPFCRALFDDVPRYAWLSNPLMVTEAEATAAHYAASGLLADGDVVAIYDLGGGAFDVMVVRKVPGGVEVLGTPEGIDVGGGDFDEAILSYVDFAAGGVLSKLDGRDPQTAVVLARLRRDCVRAKEALSVDTETIVPVFLAGRHFDVPLRRSDFENLVRAQIESTIGALSRTLRSAHVEPIDLSAVLLVGGSSRIPLVARMVSAELGTATVVDTHPYAVALGAAMLGEKAAPNPTQPGSTIFGNRLPMSAEEQRRTAPAQRMQRTHERDLAELRKGGEKLAQGTAKEPNLADSDVQFTVYRPKRVYPERWHKLLAFAHRSTPFVNEDGDSVNPLAAVTEQARRELGTRVSGYDSVLADSAASLPRGNEIFFEPWIEEGAFNPERAVIRWEETIHRVDFRFRVHANADGRRLNGGMRVFLGVLLIGDLRFSIHVDSDAVDRPDSPAEAVRAKPYRRIFASYSHHDTAIVDRIRAAASAFGDRYLIDVADLRAGEIWHPRIMELITEADIFQLFWSNNSMRAPYIRQEWEHALSLNRPHFIRPVYWEDPRPADLALGLPPAALTRLQFCRLAPFIASPVSTPTITPTPASPKGRSRPVIVGSARMSRIPPSPRMSAQMRPRMIVLGTLLAIIAALIFYYVAAH